MRTDSEIIVIKYEFLLNFLPLGLSIIIYYTVFYSGCFGETISISSFVTQCLRNVQINDIQTCKYLTNIEKKV